MEGVDKLYQQTGVPPPPNIPILVVFYADDPILLSSDPIDLQTRFTLLESLGAKIGLTLNRDKTVLLLGKVRHKSTLGTSRYPNHPLIRPMNILYNDGTSVKITESETYLGSCLLYTSPSPRD